MKLETINKSKKKNILIGGLIVLSLVSVVTYTTTRAKYRSVQSVRLASGSVNFKGADMSLVAINVSEDGSNYSGSSTLPSGNYELNTTKSKCRIPTSTLTGENAPEDPHARIEYVNGDLNFLGIRNKNTKCYVYLDKVNRQPASDVVTAIINSSMYKGSKTTGFGTKATGDGVNTDKGNSGIFSTADPIYKTTDNPNPVSYYWRGTAPTNHVVFAGKCWRIIRINGDGSFRLIYNGISTTDNKCGSTGRNTKNVLMTNWDTGTGYYYATSGGAADKSYYVGWTYGTDQRTLAGTDSYAKRLTEDWFKDSANFTADQRDQVATGYFCNDRNVGTPPTKFNWSSNYTTTWVESGTRFTYAGAKRLYEDYAPTLSCNDGDKYQLQVGAITADEVEFAGSSYGVANASYYLYTGKQYWTMSPAWLDSWARVFVVYENGGLDNDWVRGTYGVRPVINLYANNVMFEIGGEGTESNPYVVI